MDITLTFRDSQEEINYGLYSHRIEYNLFKRLLYSMLIGSFSGSIYFLIIANYLYLCLGSYMFLQTLLANHLSKKSIYLLNIVSFIYQLEIQTLLAALITQLDSSLQRGTIMIITTAAFQLSMCLSIGTKSYLKLIINLYSTCIQVILSSIIEKLSIVWIGFAFFSMVFAFQVTYYQEYEKRQKYTLHQNTERIKENLINQIDIPILKCKNNEKDLKLEFQESNNSAKNIFKITNQESFIKFTREVSSLELRTGTHFSKQLSTLSFCGQQTLETVLRKFFNRQIFQEQMSHQAVQAYRCKVKHQTHEFQCQLILLEDTQPFCIIYLQRTYDEYIGRMNQKMIILNQLLQRSIKETFNKVNDQQMLASRLLEQLKHSSLIDGVRKLDQELFQLSIFLANCKLLFNSPKIKYFAYKECCLLQLIKAIILHFKYSLAQKKIKVRFYQTCKNTQITGNEILMKQVLYNVFENAVVYSKDRITINLQEQIDLNIDKEYFILTVSNKTDTQTLENNHKQLKLGHLVVNKILREIGPFDKISFKSEANLYTAEICLFKQF